MKNNSMDQGTKSPTSTPPAEQKVVVNDQGLHPFQELYIKKDYKAAANYLLDNKQQLPSGIFHYNLGTVYSKMGEHATARYHLEKAIKEGYINSATLNNLSYVRSQLNVDDLSTSTSFPDRFINTATNVPGQLYLTLTLTLGLFFLLMFRGKKLVSKFTIFIAVLCTLLPAAFNKLYVEKINYAVTLKEVPLYEGPSKIFAEKGKVRAGSKVLLGEFRDGWFFVEFPLSLAGWVSKDQLGIY